MSRDPYKPPTTPPETKPPFRWTALRIWLAILVLPAAVVAFLCTCTATGVATGVTGLTDDPTFPVVVGIIGAAAVGGWMIYMVVRLNR